MADSGDYLYACEWQTESLQDSHIDQDETKEHYG
jgi:hypothetical protein